MYKLVAIDLDETLYDDQRNICKRNKEAIQKAIQLGVKIVPCSGRSPKFLGDLYEQLDLDKHAEYSILANGGIIVENKTNTVIDINPIPFSKVEELFHFGRSHHLCIQIFLKDRVYFYYADEQEKEAVRGFGEHMHFLETDDIFELQNESIIKVLFQKVDMDYLRSLESALQPITENEITISFSSNRYLELNRIGIDKGKGLAHLADYLHINIEDTIGIGDNTNDLQLIQDAGLGCAVANAIDEVKEVADYICISNNNEGAVGEVIENFILNKVG